MLYQAHFSDPGELMRTTNATSENYPSPDVKIRCKERLRSSGNRVDQTDWDSCFCSLHCRACSLMWFLDDQRSIFHLFHRGTLSPVFAPGGTIPQMAVCRGGWLIHPPFVIISLIGYFLKITCFRRFLRNPHRLSPGVFLRSDRSILPLVSEACCSPNKEDIF